ncbi:MAG: diguanylate cyclase [Rhodospirillales bacterium]|nr:diguanylate cyclase [Rhodospirillales bacterium]
MRRSRTHFESLRSWRKARADEPVRLAPNIWWVGHAAPDEHFQCHSYLIEHGDQSVLIDPGSELNFRVTFRKIERILPFRNIRHFVCSHQDPDITGALPTIDSIVKRKDAQIVTHWRAAVLLKHYPVRLPFWDVEANHWRLDLGQGRRLKFVFTPYAHFPGAFATFDPTSRILFSSDLFGGMTDEFQLLAEDESHFESIRPFHEHYVGSREILLNAIAKTEECQPRVIAPQHGSILTGKMVPFILDKLKGVDCGLFLLAQRGAQIERLSKLNRVLREITNTLVLYRDFQDIADQLLALIKDMVPAETIEFHALIEDGQALHFAPETRHRGQPHPLPPALRALLRKGLAGFETKSGARWRKLTAKGRNGKKRTAVVLPLLGGEGGQALIGLAVIHFAQDRAIDDYSATLFSRIQAPLQVALERESIYRRLDLERQKFYEQSIRDPLTGLHTRLYLNDTLARYFHLHDRGESGAGVALALFDIDHFKRVNDSFGHNQGDLVLRRVAQVLTQTLRGGDLAVRLGGEEFAVVLVGDTIGQIGRVAERIRKRVKALAFEGPLADHRLTISGGVAVRRKGETIDAFIERADVALYRAKNEGRNRIREASDDVCAIPGAASPAKLVKSGKKVGQGKAKRA